MKELLVGEIIKRKREEERKALEEKIQMEKDKKMKVLVTGGTGMVGSHFMKSL